MDVPTSYPPVTHTTLPQPPETAHLVPPPPPALPSAPPTQPPKTKQRPLDVAHLQSTPYFKMRAIVKERRPHVIEAVEEEENSSVTNDLLVSGKTFVPWIKGSSEAVPGLLLGTPGVRAAREGIIIGSLSSKECGSRAASSTASRSVWSQQRQTSRKQRRWWIKDMQIDKDIWCRLNLNKNHQLILKKHSTMHIPLLFKFGVRDH